jgi:hypothetical protein
MRYADRVKKTVWVLAGSLGLVFGAAPAAYADHGSAWSLRQSGPFNGGGASAGVAGWIVGAVLVVAILFAAARIVWSARTGRGSGSNVPDGRTMPLDLAQFPAERIKASGVKSGRGVHVGEPATAGRFKTQTA